MRSTLGVEVSLLSRTFYHQLNFFGNFNILFFTCVEVKQPLYCKISSSNYYSLHF